jgi:hypothetical protein
VTDEILAWLASVSKDPLAFVLGAFPWSEGDTTLEAFSGPDEWQRGILQDLADGLLTPTEAIQLAVASGHGIGKSALVAWIILWAFMTFPDARGVVTANTEAQLKTKTWAELGKWFNLCWFAREHFSLTATALLSKDPTRERTWRIDQITWSEKNTEAFAGLHNKGKRILLIMDEASAIPDKIWEVAEGALTDADTQIIWIAFGNPTKNSGRFKECFPGGVFAQDWKTRKIDSRTVAITNKKRLQRWVEAYGEDSDFVRIRVKGEFPRHGMMEFFSAHEVEEAMKREVYVDPRAPLALGIDVARYGMNNSVIFPRKGRDARSIPRQVFSGINTSELTDKIFDAWKTLSADGLLIDGGGVGGGVVDQTRRRNLHCYEIAFGGRDLIYNTIWGNDGEKYANNRAYMYGACRAWLRTGAIPDDPELKRQMLAIKYTFNNKDEILLERKEDLEDEDGTPISVDDIDGLVLTFSHAIARAEAGAHAGTASNENRAEFEYDPFSTERLSA